MARRQTKTSRFSAPSKRTQVVWGCFVGAITLVGGLLALSDHKAQPGFLATSLSTYPERGIADPIFQIAAPLDRTRWKSIVIHDLGAPAGDAESVHRRHVSFGYQGLGYHFLIGNGNGLGDGVVHAGYRWNDQLPGAHALGDAADWHNQHSISICLIGNGDRRPFTDRQIAHLTNLVQRLQRELNIPASSVYLHRDIAEGMTPAITSPGRYFPAAQLREQLN
ncbi:MAG TPA: peptidoglycan recognition family protein [Phycisphaerales bacterium]|nr:peptidoglycan recognition family protein [Phycisphaerales bacterium]HRQ76743.1 peptidoglycan recognition family protein [Phycisphaerales bacterium]